jgi:hypothetical protein
MGKLSGMGVVLRSTRDQASGLDKDVTGAVASVFHSGPPSFRLYSVKAPANAMEDEDASCMGIVPQQLRGSFRSFTTNVLAGMPFPQCTACGKKVLEGWAAEGADFVIKVCCEQPFSVFCACPPFQRILPFMNDPFLRFFPRP